MMTTTKPTNHLVEQLGWMQPGNSTTNTHNNDNKYKEPRLILLTTTTAAEQSGGDSVTTRMNNNDNKTILADTGAGEHAIFGIPFIIQILDTLSYAF